MGPLDNFFDGHYSQKRSGLVAFIRAKRRGDKTYYYLVETKREGNKVKQKVLKYLGTSPQGKDRSDLEKTKE